MSRLPALHHVNVVMPAGGEHDARAFYAGLLGLTEIEKPLDMRGRGGCWFSTGTVDVHVSVDPDFAPAKKAHIAIQVADLAELEETLRAAGYPITPDVDLPGLRRFHTEDPFGNRTEIMAALA